MSEDVAIQTQDLHLYYGSFHALQQVSLTIRTREITALIGPSGCGKSTLLRTFNRMNDTIEGVRIQGKVEVLGEDIYQNHLDLRLLRKRVGMVFQRPNPFPLSVFENVAYGLRIHGLARREMTARVVEASLRSVELWDALKDRLKASALALSPEQQQRLCIARLVAVKPDILLMDEPCSALDPLATAKIEELMHMLKKEYTIVVVTHNMQQAARVSDYTAYMYLGVLVEYGTTQAIFTNPTKKETEDYITGRFG